MDSFGDEFDYEAWPARRVFFSGVKDSRSHRQSVAVASSSGISGDESQRTQGPIIIGIR